MGSHRHCWWTSRAGAWKPSFLKISLCVKASAYNARGPETDASQEWHWQGTAEIATLECRMRDPLAAQAEEILSHLAFAVKPCLLLKESRKQSDSAEKIDWSVKTCSRVRCSELTAEDETNVCQCCRKVFRQDLKLLQPSITCCLPDLYTPQATPLIFVPMLLEHRQQSSTTLLYRKQASV